jgi:hypothetical protein
MTHPTTVAVGMDETDSRIGAGRWGVATIKPDGDYTLVVAIARHVYAEPARGVTERVMPGMFYWMESHRVAGNVAAGLVHRADVTPFDWWQAERRILAVEDAEGVTPKAVKAGKGALTIAMGVGYDPGSAAFRLHTAINETTKHASAFSRWGDTNPHCSLRQYDAQADAHKVRESVLQADVLHNHVAYFLLNNTGLGQRDDQVLIRHYHGSATNGRTNLEPAFDTAKNAVLLGARLQLCEEAASFGLSMAWSPIPMPVRRYRALRDAVRSMPFWVPLDGEAAPDRPLRIAHTPTNMRLKGTDVLRRVVHALQQRGVPVALDMIHDVPLRVALERQAACDVTFDSFWLGIQGSGLQAASMEQAVVAGDTENAAIYARRIGAVPYTFADDERGLTEVLERLAMDPAYRASEAARVSAYAETYHDYAVVGAMYERVLAKVTGNQSVITSPTRRMPVVHP